MKWRGVQVAMCATALLVACGGGGGGAGGGSAGMGPTSSVSGNVPAPSAGPGDTAAYFPLAAGSSGLYDEAATSTAGFPTTAQNTIIVSGTKSVLGATAAMFSVRSTAPGCTPFDEFFAASAGSVTFYGNDLASDALTNQTVPYTQLLFPVSAGPVSKVVGTG